jgi:hypothetical protein
MDLHRRRSVLVRSRSGNASAHCIPGILKWLDRADIAGLNATRPFAIHYGELDIPGPDNLSAAFNESAAGALDEVRRIYVSAGAIDAISVYISEGIGHEMDLNVLREFAGRW